MCFEATSATLKTMASLLKLSRNMRSITFWLMVRLKNIQWSHRPYKQPKMKFRTEARSEKMGARVERQEREWAPPRGSAGGI